MAAVNFTYALKRFFPEIKPQDIDAHCVREILDILEQRFPGMRSYILDDQGMKTQTQVQMEWMRHPGPNDSERRDSNSMKTFNGELLTANCKWLP